MAYGGYDAVTQSGNLFRCRKNDVALGTITNRGPYFLEMMEQQNRDEHETQEPEESEKEEPEGTMVGSRLSETEDPEEWIRKN